MKRLARSVATGILAFSVCAGTAGAQVHIDVTHTVLLPMSPETAAKGAMVMGGSRFLRRDDGPKYVAVDELVKSKMFPHYSRAAMVKALDEFAASAPSMGCRTDDVGDAYEIAVEAMMIVFNGTRFKMFDKGPPIRCASGSFGVIQLYSAMHIRIGSALSKKTDREKQAIYELVIILSSYIADEVVSAKNKPKELVRARQDASDFIKSIYGVRAERVRFSDQGVEIDDQYRP